MDIMSGELAPQNYTFYKAFLYSAILQYSIFDKIFIYKNTLTRYEIKYCPIILSEWAAPFGFGL